MARFLIVTSPPLHGADVRRVQERLARAGYAPGPIDGVYGALTAAAVRAFQRDHGLERDGIVGPLTRAALRGETAPPPHPGRGPSPLGLRALAEARRHLGLRERRGNRTPFGAWFGIDGIPWCNVFVSYCFAVGASYVICESFAGSPGVRTGKGCAYVPTTASWLRAAGFWRARGRPQPGDVVVYSLRATQDHIGIVESPLVGGGVRAIEGNSGDGVRRRERAATVVDGWGRIRP